MRFAQRVDLVDTMIRPPDLPSVQDLWPQLLEVLLADSLQLSALSGLTSAAGSDLAQGYIPAWESHPVND